MKSQFHFGSIQTITEEVQSYVKEYVSIPLWFNSNLWEKMDIDKKNEQSLNSTLVQFKLREDDYICCCEYGSQFHFGSIQTFDFLSSIPPLLEVSIPLWFNSNTKYRAGVGESK